MGCVSQKQKPKGPQRPNQPNQSSAVKESPPAAQPSYNNPNHNSSIAHPNDPATNNNRYASNISSANDPHPNNSKVASGIYHNEPHNSAFGADPATGSSHMNHNDPSASGMKRAEGNPVNSGARFESMMEKEDRFGGVPMQSGVHESNPQASGIRPQEHSGVHSSNPYVYNQTSGSKAYHGGNEEKRSNIQVSVHPPQSYMPPERPYSEIKGEGMGAHGQSSVMVKENPSSGQYSFGQPGMNPTDSKMISPGDSRVSNPYNTGNKKDSVVESMMNSLAHGKIQQEDVVPNEYSVKPQGYQWDSNMLKLK